MSISSYPSILPTMSSQYFCTRNQLAALGIGRKPLNCLKLRGFSTAPPPTRGNLGLCLFHLAMGNRIFFHLNPQSQVSRSIFYFPRDTCLAQHAPQACRAHMHRAASCNSAVTSSSPPPAFPFIYLPIQSPRFQSACRLFSTDSLIKAKQGILK